MHTRGKASMCVTHICHTPLSTGWPQEGRAPLGSKLRKLPGEFHICHTPLLSAPESCLVSSRTTFIPRLSIGMMRRASISALVITPGTN
eukprot:6620413-Pyramimonas_sp.AAC.2